MTPAARERLQVRVPLLSVSAAAWMLLATDSGRMAMPSYCSAAPPGALPSLVSVERLMALNPPTSRAADWVLMLAAMMVPMLIGPVRHVRDRSFARRRLRAIVLFVAMYAAVWMAAGAVLLEFALAVQLVVPVSAVPVALVAFAGVVWQCSPIKQRCLNRCHSRPAIAAFGRAADADAIRYGLTQGVWCVGSCWLLMLLPLLIAGWHVAAMAAVALWLCAERLATPAPPRWAFRGPGKALRIAIAQSRTALQF